MGGTSSPGGAGPARAGCQIAALARALTHGSAMDNNARALTALLLAIFAARCMRLVPHPPNFSPIAAMALFSGAYLPRRWLAFAAPLARLVLSDLVLGFYPELAVRLSQRRRDRADRLGDCPSAKRRCTLPARRLPARSCSSSLTNFGVWLMRAITRKTLAGLGRLLCRGHPVLPEHPGRRPGLRRPAVRRLRAGRADAPRLREPPPQIA